MDRRVALGFLGYLCIGTAVVLVPSLMPSITADFQGRGWSLATLGLLVPAGAAGGICGTMLAGIGSDFLGHKRLISGAAALLALALTLTATATPWPLFVWAFVGVSIAQSALSTGINAMIAHRGEKGRGRALNMLHGIYGLGAAASPLVIGWALGQGLPWRLTFVATGLVWLSYGLIVWLVVPNDQTGDIERADRKLDWGMLRAAPFLALFLVAFIYNGVAVSLLTWIAVFAEQSTRLPAFLSISMVSVFYVALTLGRFGCALVAERLRYARMLLVLSGVVAVAYPLVVWSNHAVLIVLGVFCTGLGLSGLFPTVLADGARRFPLRIGTVTATLSIALTLGSLVPPIWTSLLADAFGLRVALGGNYVLVIALIVLARYLGTNEGVVAAWTSPSNDVAETGSHV